MVATPIIITVGITGQIGCGKSVVAAEFKRLGAKVISGDEIGRRVVETSPRLLKSLAKEFGSEILLRTGRLNRARLAKAAFASEDGTNKLNRIVHPWLLRELRGEISKARRKAGIAMLVIDAALIFDWGLESELDYVIVVESTRANQFSRLVRRGLSQDEIRSRIARQIPKAVQRRQADVVLRNNATEDQLRQRATRLFRQLTHSS